MDWITDARYLAFAIAMMAWVVLVYAAAVGTRYGNVPGLSLWGLVRLRVRDFTLDQRVGLVVGVSLIGFGKHALLDGNWGDMVVSYVLGVFALVMAWRRLGPGNGIPPRAFGTGHRLAVVRWTALVVLVVFTMLMAGCAKEPKTTARVNAEYSVDRLFVADGCTVYRFYDDMGYRYFTNCHGSTSWEESCGKHCTTEAGVSGGAQ